MESQEEEPGRSLNAYLLLKDDIEEGDLNRPEMTTAKLLCTLENAMHRAMQEKQYSAVASNAKFMKLIGWEAKNKVRAVSLRLWRKFHAFPEYK